MKKLLVIAVAAALAAPAAMADTTLYGKLHASVGSVKTVTAGVSSTASTVEGHSSRLGVKGATALDNGMEATYGLEYGLNLDGDAGNGSTVVGTALAARNTFVGLKGKFGEVRVGRHDTPAKLATAGLDQFADTYADMSNIIATDSHRVNNAVAYINKFGPVTVAAAHSTAIGGTEVGGNAAAALGVTNTTNNANTMMLSYGNGPWTVSAGGTTIQNLGKTTNIGVSWKSEAGHNVSLVSEKAKGKGVATGNAGVLATTFLAATGPVDTVGIPGTDAVGNALTDKNLYLAGGYKIGNVMLKAGYGTSKRSGDAASTFNGTEKQTTVGVDYSLGKKTSVYLLSNNNKNTNHASGATLANSTKATAVGLVTEF